MFSHLLSTVPTGIKVGGPVLCFSPMLSHCSAHWIKTNTPFLILIISLFKCYCTLCLFSFQVHPWIFFLVHWCLTSSPSDFASFPVSFAQILLSLTLKLSTLHFANTVLLINRQHAFQYDTYHYSLMPQQFQCWHHLHHENSFKLHESRYR
jgi:hypothetical protein